MATARSGVGKGSEAQDTNATLAGIPQHLLPHHPAPWCVVYGEVMCELLNSYFGSVFTSEIVNNDLPEVRNMFVEDNNQMLNNIEITHDIISSKLSKLYGSWCRWIGSQNFSGKCGYIKVYPYCIYIYRKSLESGIVPGEWRRKANVMPIFKKGMNYYRLIINLLV